MCFYKVSKDYWSEKKLNHFCQYKQNYDASYFSSFAPKLLVGNGEIQLFGVYAVQLYIHYYNVRKHSELEKLT